MLRQAQAITPPWRQRLEHTGLARPADLLNHSPTALPLTGHWQALTKPGLGGRQRWRWELTEPDGSTTVVYVKRYAHTDLKAQWDRIRRQSSWHSRAWWEFLQAQRLADGYIPTPEPVGLAEEMSGWFERRSVVLLAAVDGDAFDRVWAEAVRLGIPITHGLARHDIAVRLARFVAAFHQTGFCHRDLYLCHIFVDLDLAGRRPPHFTLIDLARTLQPRIWRMRWIIKDLSQLDSSARQIGATRADRLRFLRAYLGLQRNSPRVRWYARRIVRKSNWILRRIERKSRCQ